MAAPKVFISSTCFDLREVRESLCKVVRDFGFEPVLSEKGDVFYHPDLHTHDSCIYEISNCQLFILLIGGRFGGAYVSDKTKSITNAEYEAAAKKKIPIFTYIKKSVLDNHHLYQSNIDKEFINDLNFPAIEKAEDAKFIFEFINRVRKASVNNAYEPFDTTSDIENHLRKQWASMFFDFLKNRELSAQLSQNSQSIDGLRNTADKLEELVKSLYKTVDKVNAEDEIYNIEIISLAKEFLNRYVREFITHKVKAKDEEELEELSEIDPHQIPWYEYVARITGMIISTELDEDESPGKITYQAPDEILDQYESDSEFPLGFMGFTVNTNQSATSYEAENEYLYKNGLCKLDQEQRLDVLREFSSMSWLGPIF